MSSRIPIVLFSFIGIALIAKQRIVAAMSNTRRLELLKKIREGPERGKRSTGEYVMYKPFGEFLLNKGHVDQFTSVTDGFAQPEIAPDILGYRIENGDCTLVGVEIKTWTISTEGDVDKGVGQATTTKDYVHESWLVIHHEDYASKRHGNFIPHRVSFLKRNGIGLAVMEPTDSGWDVRVIHHPVRFDSPYFFQEKWGFIP